MTEPQRRRFYFPVWRRAWAAGWLPDGQPRAENASEARDMIEQIAGMLARTPAYAGATPEKIRRHAANCLAMMRRWLYTGQPVPDVPDWSSGRMTTLDLMLFAALCNWAADPTWLGNEERPGLMQWQHPDLLERQIYLAGLRRRFVGNYITALSQKVYGTRDVRNLQLDQLRNLYRLAWERPRSLQPA